MNNKKILVNMGCGNKIRCGTENEIVINVDIVSPKETPYLHFDSFNDFMENAGDSQSMPVFIKSDVMNLKEVFPDNVIDTIECFHVIEHIHVYKLEDTLKEWYRILKPDGQLIAEMPDMVKCCINYLQGLTTGNFQIYHRLGIMGMYGEQKPDQPFMEHKWGWSFGSLAPVFKLAGFKNVFESEAQTHMKHLRDFRITGVK